MDLWRELAGDDRAAAEELWRIRNRLEKDEKRRDEILAMVLSPNLQGEKAFSYRLAAMLSGVSHETLRRRFT